jgi:hypothetical protein
MDEAVQKLGDMPLPRFPVAALPAAQKERSMRQRGGLLSQVCARKEEEGMNHTVEEWKAWAIGPSWKLPDENAAVFRAIADLVELAEQLRVYREAEDAREAWVHAAQIHKAFGRPLHTRMVATQMALRNLRATP